MELNFKYLIILNLILMKSICLIEKKEPTKKISTISKESTSKGSPLYKYSFVKFPFKKKHQNKNKEEVDADSENPNSTNPPEIHKPDDSKEEIIVTPAREIENPEGPLEKWIFMMKDCTIEDIAKREGEKMNPSAKEPVIEILEYDKETGKYEVPSDDGVENDFFYDPVSKIIRDDTDSLTFGFKIDNHFIDRGNIEVVNKTEIRSIFHTAIFQSGTYKGMNVEMEIHDSTDKKGNVIMKINCMQQFVRKEYVENERNKFAGRKAVKVMLGLWLLFSLKY